jgi:hypothetical protein
LTNGTPASFEGFWGVVDETKRKYINGGREIDIRRADVDEIPRIESEDISSLKIGEIGV